MCMFVEHCGYVPTCMLYTYMYIHVLYILQHYIFVLCITTCTLYICIYLVVVLLHVVTVIMYTHVHVLMRD